MSIDEPPRAEAVKGAYQPFIPPDQSPRELTIRALVIGSILGLAFAMSSVYLGLKVGLTVSASIPVAVLSITVFRWLRMRATILENNIVQTTGSAGESLAAGVAFTLPSLLLMGFEMELVRVLLVALLGGLIGVLMMIPLRHGLIVKEHGKLMYPEGTACADVLIVGEKGGTEATTVFLGFFVGLGYAFLNLIMKLWGDVAQFKDVAGSALKKATIGFEVSPPMLGVGYIIGPKVAANMVAGGLLAFVVLIPLLAEYGGPTIAAMSPGDIRNNYVLYIGAGAVAAGGFIALARAIPTIISAFRRGMGSLGGARVQKVLRTDRDISMRVVLGGVAALAVAIFIAPVLEIDILTALLVILFGFFFVTVSSRITGEIGSSSNPISGMTIATLLLTCGLFVLLGRTAVGFKAMALTTAALVCVAASNGGTISQDLKTGFLVGATPRYQQIAILVGVVTSAIVIGFTLLFLNQSWTTYPAVSFPTYTVPYGSALPPGIQTTDQTEEGPDGKSYKVTYIQTHRLAPPAGVAVPRGKYLVDDTNHLAYFVDPGVSGSYPFKLEKMTGALPPGSARDPSGAVVADGQQLGKITGTELGVDHKMYDVLELSESAGGLRPGRYLIEPGGSTVAYLASPVIKFDAPKAQLFRLIIDGIIVDKDEPGSLPWGLVLIGVFIAIILELVGVSSLPFAVGLYLPIFTSGGIFVGGAVRWLVDRKRRGESSTEAEFSPGMLMASGLIAGGAILGVIQAGLMGAEVDKMLDLSRYLPDVLLTNGDWWPMTPFILMAAGLFWVGIRKKKVVPTATVIVAGKDNKPKI
jgi:putative OPT family oligopeptide transporter